MIRRLLPGLALAATAATVALPAAASAATYTTSGDGLYHTTTLTHQGVEDLVAHGDRITVHSNFVGKVEVRVFTQQRALTRGGLKTKTPASYRTWISNNEHLTFTHVGTQTITVHIYRADGAALLKAGSITEGYFAAGYTG